MTHITTRLVLGDGPFAACGRPTGIYRDQHAGQFAVASSFEPMQWHGRDARTGCALEFRVAVYGASSLRCLAVLDRARYPINDVVFHPHKPMLAVATGCYDGGYFYQGELLLWDLGTGAVVSLLDEKREVTRCRFDDSGQALAITMRPRDETEDDDEEPGRLFFHATIVSDAWETLGAGGVVVKSLSFTTMVSQDPVMASARGDTLAVQRALHQLAAAADRVYEPRWCVWDVAWTAKGEILAVRNNTALERWAEDGERVQHLADPRDGVQLFPAPNGDVYVNLFARKYSEGWTLDTSVERITPDTGERRAVGALDFPALLSITEAGALLARDTDPNRQFADASTREGQTVVMDGPAGFSVTVHQSRPYHTERGRDCVVLPESVPLWYPEHGHQSGGFVASDALDMGRYDIFSHYLRIDAASQLYFLRNIPPDPWKERWVCRIDAYTLQVERLFLLDWDPAQQGYLQPDGGAYLADEAGESLLLACHRVDARGPKQFGAEMVRRSAEGAVLWTTFFDAPVTALVVLPKRRLVVFSLASGSIGLLSANTGVIEVLEPVILDSVPCVCLSLAAKDDQLVAGMLDGRIVVYELTA